MPGYPQDDTFENYEGVFEMLIENRDAAESTRDITFPHPREETSSEKPY